METRASRSSLFLRESWPVLEEEWTIDRFEDSAANFTSGQQQDNLPACCKLPCSDKTEGSREERRQRRDDPRERRSEVV